MTPADFKACRVACGLTQSQWGRALGYDGKNCDCTVRRYENGAPGRPLPDWIARLADMYRRHGIPPEWISQ